MTRAEPLHVLWDFDNTLATCGPIWSGTLDALAPNLDRHDGDRVWRHWNAALPWMQDAIPHATLFPGESYYGYLTRTLHDALATVGTHATFSERELRRTVGLNMQYVLVDGAREAIDACAARGYVNHLASNHVPDLPDLLSRLGLRDAFRHLFISGVMGHEKPSDAFWQQVESTVAAAPPDLVMIGDNWRRDIEPAIARGYRAVWVTTPERQQQRVASSALLRMTHALAMVPALVGRV